MDPEDLRIEHEGTMAALATRIRAEYEESPGLRLTELQIQRLFMLERDVCSVVLSSLVEAGFLSRDASGRYRKA